jgi:hypothetical protein
MKIKLSEVKSVLKKIKNAINEINDEYKTALKYFIEDRGSSYYITIRNIRFMNFMAITFEMEKHIYFTDEIDHTIKLYEKTNPDMNDFLNRSAGYCADIFQELFDKLTSDTRF